MVVVEKSYAIVGRMISVVNVLSASETPGYATAAVEAAAAREQGHYVPVKTRNASVHFQSSQTGQSTGVRATPGRTPSSRPCSGLQGTSRRLRESSRIQSF